MDIVILIFDKLTALDAVGPYEVLSRLPGARLRFVAPQRGLVRSDNGFLALSADQSIDEVSHCDLLLVSGGFGSRLLENDERVLAWLRAVDETTRVTAAVCTGSLLLARAGLLNGRRASTHWPQRHRLGELGAVPVAEGARACSSLERDRKLLAQLAMQRVHAGSRYVPAVESMLRDCAGEACAEAHCSVRGAQASVLGNDDLQLAVHVDLSLTGLLDRTHS